MCGGHVDFLKMDCEGAEWCITPDELKGIRRIEAEIHNFDGTHNLLDFVDMLSNNGYKYTLYTPREGLLHIHAFLESHDTSL